MNCDKPFGFLALIASSVLWLPLSLYVFFICSEWPWFSQVRVGRNFRLFRIYKIKTMRTLPGDFPNTTAINDPRFFLFSAEIRRFKADEILQFINLLDGTMAFFGPRPNIPEEVELRTEAYKELLTVKPGIVDPAALRFFRIENVVQDWKDADQTYRVQIWPKKLLYSRIGMSVEGSKFSARLVLIFCLFACFFGCNNRKLSRAYLMYLRSSRNDKS